MRKIFAIVCFLLMYGAASGQLSQFRMIGSGSWSTVNDSTFSSTVTIQSDLTGNGFLPTGITDSMLVFSQTGQRYTITSAINLTFSSADLTIEESGGNWGTPVGQVMIYEDNENTAVPNIPFGATGATAKMQEAVDTYNSSVIGVIDSTRLVQDSILVYFQSGVEVGRDTIATTLLSGSAITANTVTISAGTNSSTYTFPVAKPDTNYIVTTGVSAVTGLPSSAELTVSISKTVNDITFTAQGTLDAGEEIKVDFMVIDSAGTSSGSDAFIGLSDTPGSYSGQANKMVLVNPTEDGLIFADTSGIGSGGGSSYVIPAENVIYISKKSGDNGTATRGDMTKPFRDMWAARDSIQKGDLVIVFPGLYTAGDSGSGADAEDDTTDESFNLWKDSVTYYFHPGAKIQITTSNDRPLFAASSSGGDEIFRVLGHGDFVSNSWLGNWKFITSGDKSFTFIANEVVSENIVRANSYIEDFNIRINKYTKLQKSTTPTQFVVYLGPDSDQTIESIGGTINIDIDYATIGDSVVGANRDNPAVFLRYGGLQDFRIKAKINGGSFLGKNTHRKCGLFNQSDGRLKNVYSKFEFSNLNILDPFIEEGVYTSYILEDSTDLIANLAVENLKAENNPAGQGCLFGFYNKGPLNDSLVHFDVDLENISSHIQILGEAGRDNKSGDGESIDVKYTFNVNNLEMLSNSPVLFLSGRGASDSANGITLDINFQNTSADSLILVLGRNDIMPFKYVNFSGQLFSRSEGVAMRYKKVLSSIRFTDLDIFVARDSSTSYTPSSNLIEAFWRGGIQVEPYTAVSSNMRSNAIGLHSRVTLQRTEQIGNNLGTVLGTERIPIYKSTDDGYLTVDQITGNAVEGGTYTPVLEVKINYMDSVKVLAPFHWKRSGSIVTVSGNIHCFHPTRVAPFNFGSVNIALPSGQTSDFTSNYDCYGTATTGTTDPRDGVNAGWVRADPTEDRIRAEFEILGSQTETYLHFVATYEIK